MVPHLCNAFDMDAARKEGATPVFLIRHGQTEWNREGRFLGRTDLPLDETGMTQAQKLADRLSTHSVSHVYASPLARALQTATELSRPHGLEPRAVEGIIELDQGDLEGREGRNLAVEFPDFFAAWRQDPTHARIPGGETLADCHARSVRAIHSLLADHSAADTVVVVSHKVAISAIICDVLGLPPRYNMMVEQANTAINLLAWNAGSLSLLRLNDHEHL